MAGAGNAILFMASLVGLTIWSMLLVTFAAHYFLTTLTESAAGHDEIRFPREGFLDWWWKPLLCLWVLSAWVVPVTIFLAPLMSTSPLGFALAWFAILWIVFPLSLLSILYAGNGFFFLHPIVVWRALRHWKGYLYVNFLTLLSGWLAVGFLVAAFRHHYLWSAFAIFVVPTAILFYARNWGRFAWLALNFAPRKRKTPRDANPFFEKQDDDVPVMDVEVIDSPQDGIREGLPPTGGHFQERKAPVPDGFVAGPPPHPAEADEFSTDTSPYPIVDGDHQLPFAEKNPLPVVPAAHQTTSPNLPEEEDEWATDKKPYDLIGDTNFSNPAEPDLDISKADADKPVKLSQHYDEQHEREKKARRKEKEKTTAFGVPAPSTKTPKFLDALFFGVWKFMIYEPTLTVWANLVLLTLVELVLLFMARAFFPRLP